MTQMIELDGNYAEGGGSIIRTALACSLLTQKPFRISKIRSNRPKPGLKPQHLHAIKAIKQLAPTCKSSQIELGTQEAWFHPGLIKSGQYNFDIKTAGSISLFLQSMLMPCLFAPAKITLNIKGGTCGKWQASVDYLQQLVIPNLQRFATKINLSVRKRGYYPKGGGEIILEISPKIKAKEFKTYSDLLDNITSSSKKFDFTNQGNLEYIKGFVNTSQDLSDKQVSKRIESAATASLRGLGVPISIDQGYFPSLSTGGELLLWTLHSNQGILDPQNCVRLGATALVEYKISSEEIGQTAAKKLKELISSNAAVDHFLADQLLIFMALLPGSKILVDKISDHVLANVYVIEQFLPVKFEIDREVKTIKTISKQN
ncbi:RNA 3'-phosphate cyclase [archaeon]|nr:RNA 3'-phosphate cyclase [archaeon]|tara:strand:+ start:644 stop:1762 length:1119 start_codon:yes stop_codon:yes gene_type:complete